MLSRTEMIRSSIHRSRLSLRPSSRLLTKRYKFSDYKNGNSLEKFEQETKLIEKRPFIEELGT